MSNVAFSQMPVATTLLGNAIVPIVQGGINQTVTANTLQTFVNGNTTGNYGNANVITLLESGTLTSNVVTTGNVQTNNFVINPQGRITGDFGNAAGINRPVVQSLGNAFTSLGVMPGPGYTTTGITRISDIVLFSNTDPSNSSFTILQHSPDESKLLVGRNGTGVIPGNLTIGPSNNNPSTSRIRFDWAANTVTVTGLRTNQSNIALGFGAASTGQGNTAIAIGVNAGQTNQANGAVAIGYYAAAQGQIANSIVINGGGDFGATTGNIQIPGLFIDPVRNDTGNVTNAVYYNDTTKEVTWGPAGGGGGSSYTNANVAAFLPTYTGNVGNVSTSGYIFGNGSFLTGISAGNISGGTFIASGTSNVSIPVANGNIVGFVGGQPSLVISSLELAVGRQAGQTNQGPIAIAVGYGAGQTNQGSEAVAIGVVAGNTLQGSYSIAIGSGSGGNAQGTKGIAIGQNAGNTQQGANTVAIGTFAGFTIQGESSVAIGETAGQTNQGAYGVAVGIGAGTNAQGARGIAIGVAAGSQSQGGETVAIGHRAGWSAQLANSIAIGSFAGASQAQYAIAIGASAGTSSQGANAIAIGTVTASTSQGANAIAIGANIGNSQGQYAIAIGARATSTGQANNSIVLNASGAPVTISNSGFYVEPIRNLTGISNAATNGQILTYNTTTNEVMLGVPQIPVIAGNIAANTAVGTPAAGMMYWDSTTSRPRMFNGTAWLQITLT